VSAKLWAVVPAAGIGARMAATKPKQYLPLLGQTIIEKTLERLLQLSQLQKIVVVIAEHDPYWPELAIAHHPKIVTVAGGRERCDSVFNGLRQLQACAALDDWVLVHDAARPCVTIAEINALLQQLQHHPDGGLLGVPASDTLKQVNEDAVVKQTVERSRYWHAQTPQIFQYQKLYRALSRALQQGLAITDEASAIELAGMRPLMVAASRNNIKITQAEDLALAEFILQQQCEETQ